MTTTAKPRPAEEPRKCPKCNGRGFAEWFHGPSRHWETCDACDGEGTVQNLHGEMTDDGMVSDE
jgi:DnaJ-class molecular chaperone